MNKQTWLLNPASNGSDVLVNAINHLGGVVVSHCRNAENEKLQLTLEPYKLTRRLRQNALYWVLVNATAEQLCEGRYLPRAWDLYYREKHLGLEGNPITETCTIAPHKNLSVRDFSNYLDKCFCEASENAVLIPDLVQEERMTLRVKA